MKSLATVTVLSMALLVSAGCATTPEPSSGDEQEEAPPLDCQLIPVGPVRVDWSPLEGRSFASRLRSMGIDRLENREAIMRTYRTADGTLVQEILGYEGIGYRYSDPACRLRT